MLALVLGGHMLKIGSEQLLRFGAQTNQLGAVRLPASGGTVYQRIPQINGAEEDIGSDFR